MSRTLAATCLLLLLALGAGAVRADGERPPPEEVASWILAGDATAARRAVEALEGADRDYLDAVVRALRGERGPQVLVETRVYAVPRGTAGSVLGGLRAQGSHFLDAEEGTRVQADLQALRGARLLSAPHVLVIDRHSATVAVTTPFSYVKEHRILRSDDEVLVDPVVATIDEGFVLEVRPVVSTDRRFVTLTGALTHAAVVRPVPTRTVTLEASDRAVEVQVPEVKETRLGLGVTVPDGAFVAGAGLEHPSDVERELFALVRVHLVAEGSRDLPLPAPERTEATVVTLEVRLLEATDEALARALGNRVPDAEMPRVGLQAEDVVRLLGPGRQGARGVEILSAPRLTTFEGQRANVSVLGQTSYLRDFEVQRGEDGRVLLDPVVDTIQDGLVFDVTPTLNESRTRIALATETTWAWLRRPIATFTTTIEGRKVEIQVPELTVSRVAQDFELEAGGYALIGGLGTADDGRRVLVLVRASVTTLDEEDAGPR